MAESSEKDPNLEYIIFESVNVLKLSTSAFHKHHKTVLTCNDSYAEIDVNDAGCKGCHNHTQRGKKAPNHHHRATPKAVH